MAKQQKKKGWVLWVPEENIPSYGIKIGGHIEFTIKFVASPKVKDAPKKGQKVTVIFEEKEVIEVF